MDTLSLDPSSTATVAVRADGDAGVPRAPPHAPRLGVGGWVRRPLQLAPSHLDAMPWQLVDDFDVVCTLDGSHGVRAPMRVVRASELIDQAGPAFRQRTDFKRVAILAEGHEGYRALFSWAELFNSPLGAGIVVAYGSAQCPLPANAGHFALLSRHDLATGPRYVRGLRSLEVHKLW